MVEQTPTSEAGNARAAEAADATKSARVRALNLAESLFPEELTGELGMSLRAVRGLIPGGHQLPPAPEGAPGANREAQIEFARRRRLARKSASPPIGE